MCPPRVAYFVFGLLDLALRPGLQGFLTQSAYFLDQPFFGVVGSSEFRTGTLGQLQQCANTASQVWMLAQSAQQCFVTQGACLHLELLWATEYPALYFTSL